MVKYGLIWLSSVWYGLECFDCGIVWFWNGLVLEGFDMVWNRLIWYHLDWYGMVRYGLVLGMVWLGMDWLGMVWFG